MPDSETFVGELSALHVVPRLCRIPRTRPYRRGVLNADAISLLYIKQAYVLGRIVLMPTERVCGGPLISCSADPPADIDASVLHRFYDAKVAGVPACTVHGCELRVFSPVTPYDVAAIWFGHYPTTSADLKNTVCRALYRQSVLQIRSLRSF